MPRQPDPDLEGRILNAAGKLWAKGGEGALTMRAVAKAAGTNTPALYRRFKDRKDILRALLQRTRAEITALAEASLTPEEVCERYVEYGLSHPHLYELFYQHEYELFHPSRAGRPPSRETRPALDAVRRKLAERLGGAPEDHTRVALALWMLAHGMAMLAIGKSLRDFEPGVRSVFTAAVAALVRESDNISRQ
ncbi:MAG TPA: TetR/AcrR family transcriptional regulator [Candidatus Sulfotelmatobacter sp.]|nr:TetR/AcrR family transcriptional regulator [Candidatus Sulfotelmatobacter sp.]